SIALPLALPAPSRGLLLRFWIELCLLLTSRYAPTLSLCWPAPPDDDAATAQLQLCFRPPPGGLFSALVDPLLPSRLVWRPGTDPAPPGVPRGAARRPAPGGSVTLWEVLHGVRPGFADGWPGWLRGSG